DDAAFRDMDNACSDSASRQRLALDVDGLGYRRLCARDVLDPAEAPELRLRPRLGLDGVIRHTELLNATGGTHGACVWLLMLRSPDSCKGSPGRNRASLFRWGE